MLLAGDRVSVVGAGRHLPDISAAAEIDYRSEIPVRLHVESSEAVPLSISGQHARRQRK